MLPSTRDTRHRLSIRSAAAVARIAIAALAFAGDDAHAASTRSPDGATALITKRIGARTWAITRDPSGTVNGISVDPATGVTEFLWCQETAWDGNHASLSCWSRPGCETPCAVPWAPAGRVDVPVSFFLADPVPEPSPIAPESLAVLLGTWIVGPADVYYRFERVVDDRIEGTTNAGVAFSVLRDPPSIFGHTYDYGLSEPADIPGHFRFFLFNRWSPDTIGGVVFRLRDHPRGYAPVDGPSPFIASRVEPTGP